MTVPIVCMSITTTNRSNQHVFIKFGHTERERGGGLENLQVCIFCTLKASNAESEVVRISIFHFLTSEHRTVLKTSLPCVENSLIIRSDSQVLSRK